MAGLVQAVEAAVRAGIVVVVAAGNIGIDPATGQPGYGGITSPGNAPPALTVGATRTYGTNARLDDTSIDPAAAVWSWWLTSSVATSSVVDGTTLTWGQNIVWGDSYNVSGSNIVWGDLAANAWAFSQSLTILFKTR